jgi:phenylalanyl-tRNA synthetase beta chain
MCRPGTGNPWYPVPDPDLPVERTHVGALLTGRVRPASWGDPEPPRADFFAAKAVVETLMRALRVEFSVEPSSDRPFLHPRRNATVLVGDHAAGWLGELHPSVAAQWDLDGVAGFELDFGVLAGAATGVPRYEDLTSFPAVRWDLAVIVDRDVPSARVVDVVRSSAGARLAHVEVFDVYEGPQAGERKKSLALHLRFRAPDRTLTEDEVHKLVEKVVAALRDQVGGELRA